MRTVNDSERDALVAFGARLRALRRERGLTQEKLAELSDSADPSHVGELERGASGDVTLRYIHRLAAALHVPARDLLP
jgi:transcriptional regulator with XRE-family HTH domain